MHELVTKANNAYKNIDLRQHAEMIEFLEDVKEAVRGGKLSEAELCDIGFITREIAKLYQEMKKEVNKTHEEINRVLGGAVVEQLMQGNRDDLTARGTFASGSAEIKNFVRVPRHDAENIDDYLKFMGLPPNCKHPAIRYSFSATQEQMEGFDEDDLPASLRGTTYSQFHVTYRKKVNKNV